MLKAAGRDATRRDESADRGGKKRSGRIKCGKVFVGGDILCFWRESLLNCGGDAAAFVSFSPQSGQ